jgi:hypothetical protein
MAMFPCKEKQPGSDRRASRQSFGFAILIWHRPVLAGSIGRPPGIGRFRPLFRPKRTEVAGKRCVGKYRIDKR